MALENVCKKLDEAVELMEKTSQKYGDVVKQPLDVASFTYNDGLEVS